jgi:DNA-binding NarL/FixJ family response regulator
MVQSRRPTNPKGSSGNLGVQTRARPAPTPAPWRTSTAVLISNTAVAKLKKTKGARKGDVVRVFLIDDNRMVRGGFAEMLAGKGLEVISVAQSGAEALRKVVRLKPHVVLIDSALSERDGLLLVAGVRKAVPAIKVILMHLLPAHQDGVAYVRAGVSGFIMKDAAISDVVATIRTVVDGGSVLPSRMTRSLFSHVADEAPAAAKRGTKAAGRMTAREREVTALIALGLGNKAIAGRLDIAAHTVKSHVHNILEKLSLHTRLEVAAYAHANGKRRTSKVPKATGDK